MKDRTGWNKYRRKQPQREAREVELHIEALTNAGDGLARLDQRVIFVPATMPGDRVRVRITQRKKTHALAQVVELLEPAAQRRQAPCELFGRCGGCDWQHVPYEQQLQAKQEQLRETLRRIGSLDDLPIQPIVASPEEYGYRNRIQGDIHRGQFHFSWRRSDQRIAVERCDIADASINDFLQQTDLTQQPQGRVEIAVVDDSVVVLPLNAGNSTELGFRQVNSAVSEQLTARLLEQVGASSCQQVIDLYCGRGLWTNRIAGTQRDKRIIGVDSSRENIAIARQQASDLGLGNVHNHQAPVERMMGKLDSSNSVCIVDPPRAGLDGQVTQALVEKPCDRLIYVSCHPATLARDLVRLTESAYQIESVLPLDMFPQTAHLECLTVLNRRDTATPDAR